MTATQFTPGEWRWNNYDETEPSKNNGKELVASTEEEGIFVTILIATGNVLAYDQDLIQRAPELFRTLDEAPSPTPYESPEEFLVRYKQWNLSRFIVLDKVTRGGVTVAQ